MDFSVLIPVFNTNIRPLVASLLEQAQKLDCQYQILLMDDCSVLSSSYLNKKVALNENVDYEILSENIGRSAIRNRLFDKAKYDYCIIIDNDVSIIKDDFIAKYLLHLNNKNLLVGGHVYTKNAPKEANKYLHWLYGTKIESSSLEERKKSIYKNFMTSNFACSKSVFKKLKFDEAIRNYGHEDTLFGIQAENQKIEIIHLDNPVQHDGLDPVEVFLKKQKSAVLNLKKLIQNQAYKEKLSAKIKLIRYASNPFLKFFSSLFAKTISNNLTTKKPSLIALQLQKVIWWNSKND